MENHVRFCQFVIAFIVLNLSLLGIPRIYAIEVTPIPLVIDLVDLTEVVEIRANHGSEFQVSTAQGTDGLVRRVTVGETEGENVDWAVFALENTSNEQIDRLLVVPHYRLVKSGVFSPDLGSERVVSVVASHGLAPVKVESLDADVYSIILDPGAIVTYVAELTTPIVPKIYLWKPNAYIENNNFFSLFQGIVLGISGLLAIFLTIVVVIKGTIMIPAAAVLAWSVLAFLCVDFGFLNKVTDISSLSQEIIRATTEILLAGSLFLFIFTYLHLFRWQLKVSFVALTTVILVSALLISGFINPSVSAGIARVVLVGVGVLGTILIVIQTFQRHERAIILIPTWIILLLLIAGAGFATSGYIDNEIIQPALNGGLVMFVLLIGLTVLQNVFANAPFAQGIISDGERLALAKIGSGDIVWDWDVENDKIYTDSQIEKILGKRPRELLGSASDWLKIIHPQDQSRYRQTLDSVIDAKRGRISQIFRLRGADGHYRAFSLKARPILGINAEVIRCVGTLHDVTAQFNSEERLLRDVLYDNLTGLPNRGLFLDRLQRAFTTELMDKSIHPLVIVFNIDRFKEINDSYGFTVGDSILLTIARRLNRILKPQDSLARIGGDQFAILKLTDLSGNQAKEFVRIIRKSLKSPINIGDSNIKISSCFGLVVETDTTTKATELLKKAEFALYHAKSLGADQIELFDAKQAKLYNTDQLTESDLIKAMDENELLFEYVPIVRLESQQVSGFSINVGWEHPKLGYLSSDEIFKVFESIGLIDRLGIHVLKYIAQQLIEWQKIVNGDQTVFANLSLAPQLILGHNFISDLKEIIETYSVTPNLIKLELTEAGVMANPEHSIRMLERLKTLGVGLVLDNFGSIYSSLNFLHRFPFDTLKIYSNIEEFSPGRKQYPLALGKIVEFAHELELEVVVVGADAETEINSLKQVGCEYVQGSVNRYPLKLEEANELVTLLTTS